MRHPTPGTHRHRMLLAVLLVPLLALATLVLLFGGALSAGAHAAHQTSHAHVATGPVIPRISLSATAGPPTQMLLVNGSSFGATEIVDLFFDRTDLAAVTTDSRGSFVGARIQVPASAVYGTHWVTGKGRRSGAAAQAPFKVQTNWNMLRDNVYHTGVNSYENVLSPTTVGGLRLAWRYPAGNYIYSSPAVVGTLVYFDSNDEHVYAIDARTGKLRWMNWFDSQDSVSSPAVANGTVYVGSADHSLWAFNAFTGSLLWTYSTGGIIQSSPAVANGVVYFGSGDDKLYALNATTGALVWSYFTGFIDSSPTVANGVVYVGSGDGHVYAFNSGTGALLWSYLTGAATSSSPAVANGMVYIGSIDSNLYALNATTGTLLRSDTTGSYIVTDPAVANGMVYVCSGNNYLNAFALPSPPQPGARPTLGALHPNYALPLLPAHPAGRE